MLANMARGDWSKNIPGIQEAADAAAALGQQLKDQSEAAQAIAQEHQQRVSEVQQGERHFVDDGLQQLWENVSYLYGALKEIDGLSRLEDLRIGDAAGEAVRTLSLLSLLSIVSKAFTEPTDNGTLPMQYPEYLLVRRLRLLNVSWAKIAEQTNVNAAGLHKRWSSILEAELGGTDQPPVEP